MSNVTASGQRQRLVWVLGIAISLVTGIVAPTSVAQQGSSFFDDLFGFGAPPQRSPAPAVAAARSAQAARRAHDAKVRRRYVRVAVHSADHAAEAPDDDRPNNASHGKHSHAASDGLPVCVRLCDGRFFALPKSTRDDATSICSAACPDAATAVFHTDGDLKDATDGDGNSYGKLQNAFAYRSRVMAECSCRKGKLGMAAIAADRDPTLEDGDIVMTQHGPVVFEGKSGDEGHANFTPLDKSSAVDSHLRHSVATLPVGTNH